MIEEPAQRPRPWVAVTCVAGALFWLAVGVGAHFDPPRSNQHELPVLVWMLPAFVYLAMGAVFLWMHRRDRIPPWHMVREDGASLRFRFSGPVEIGLVGCVLASFTAMIPAMAVQAAGPLPVWAVTVVAGGWMLGGFVPFWLLSRLFYRAGKREYVLEAGELRIPKRRARELLPAVTVQISGIRALVIPVRGGLRIALRDGEDVVLGASGPVYSSAAWLAQKLGVPLMRQRRDRPPIPWRQRIRPPMGVAVPSAYLALLSASWLYESNRASIPSARPAAVVGEWNGGMRSAGVVQVAYDDYRAPTGASARPPVIIIHGSPGRGSELGDMARAIQSYGYRVITPDLPGFGESTLHPTSLSILSHAHEVLELMDRLRIERAHVVGWSLGGGVAMHMADLAPDRVASLTLMASISDQQVEGTRSYFAEHAKYAAGFLAASAVRYGLPHFGYLDHFDDIRASMRNFWDTDMRPLTAMMQRLTVPTMILHGRHDFLVPAWNAEHSHELIGPSRLVLTEHSHFYPFMQPTIAAGHMRPFFERHDEPGAPALRQAANLAPEGPSLLGPPGRWMELMLRRASWLTLLAGAAFVMVWRLRTGAVLVFLAVSFGLIDNGIAFGAAAVVMAVGGLRAWWSGRRADSPRVIGRGTAARTPGQWRDLLRGRPIRTAMTMRWVPRELEAAVEAVGFLRAWPLRFTVAAVIASCLWVVMYFIGTIAASAFIVTPLAARLGIVGLGLGVGVSIVAVRSVELLLTRHGRRRIRITWTRLTHREYWPAELLYWPMAPLYVYWGLRYGPIAFTACNPGIENGGGMIGESKKAILDSMPEAAPWILKSVWIGPGDTQSRAAEAIRAIASDSALGYPVILKPDSGYRGFAVKLARSEADVRAYFRDMRAPALVQEYHAGPRECGVLWARNVEGNGGRQGRVFSVTRKEFPVVTGDGRRTLEQLIFRHRRYHAQAGVFLERWAADRGRVPGAGEMVRLAESGNHCQGTLFADGEALITPDLESRMNAIAGSFRGGLDIGRFDLRYESDESIKRGEGFKIIELNGVTGESTNIYDPTKSIVWAFGVTIRQWSLMYRLGAVRQRMGHRPMAVRMLLRRIREHKRSRSGSALAD